MSHPAHDTQETPAPVVIDKTTTRVNLGILASVVLSFIFGTSYLKDIEHAVDSANATLREVKAQLDRQGGTTDLHARQLTRSEKRIDALEAEQRSHTAQLKALERGK